MLKVSGDVEQSFPYIYSYENIQTYILKMM